MTLLKEDLQERTERQQRDEASSMQRKTEIEVLQAWRGGNPDERLGYFPA
jgi:hypothetical protein